MITCLLIHRKAYRWTSFDKGPIFDTVAVMT